VEVKKNYTIWDLYRLKYVKKRELAKPTEALNSKHIRRYTSKL